MRNWVRRRPVSRCRGNGVGVCEVDFLCELLAWGLAFIIIWLAVWRHHHHHPFMRPECFRYPHKSIKNIRVKFITPGDFLYSEEFIVFNHASRGPSLPS